MNITHFQILPLKIGHIPSRITPNPNILFSDIESDGVTSGGVQVFQQLFRIIQELKHRTTEPQPKHGDRHDQQKRPRHSMYPNLNRTRSTKSAVQVPGMI